MDAIQCTTDDAMNTIALVLSFPAKLYHTVGEKNLKVFKNDNSGDFQDFLQVLSGSTDQSIYVSCTPCIKNK